MENPGQKVKRLREEKGWSESNLATKIRTNSVHIRNLERNGSTTIHVISRICKEFGISLHGFFYDVEFIPEKEHWSRGCSKGNSRKVI